MADQHCRGSDKSDHSQPGGLDQQPYNHPEKKKQLTLFTYLTNKLERNLSVKYLIKDFMMPHLKSIGH